MESDDIKKLFATIFLNTGRTLALVVVAILVTTVCKAAGQPSPVDVTALPQVSAGVVAGVETYLGHHWLWFAGLAVGVVAVSGLQVMVKK